MWRWPGAYILIVYLCIVYYTACCAASLLERAPPFAAGDSADIPPHLGNYTHSHEDIEAPTYTCVATGECDVCTLFEKKTAPYCMEYGNKQPVRCKWDDPDLAEYMRNQTTLYDYDAISLPSYRGCPHVKRIEHWKFVKFEIINLAVAILSVSVVVWRQRKLAREQYRRLAQRIGVPV